MIKLETVYDLSLKEIAQTFQPKNSLRYAVKHGTLYADLTCPSRTPPHLVFHKPGDWNAWKNGENRSYKASRSQHVGSSVAHVSDYKTVIKHAPGSKTQAQFRFLTVVVVRSSSRNSAFEPQHPATLHIQEKGGEGRLHEPNPTTLLVALKTWPL